jgi:glycosyltransferase involved in cell wall biosynthesis
VRLAVYSDHWYRPRPDGLYADRALVLFLAGVARRLERMVLVGQLDPDLPRAHYRVPDRLEFEALPSYPSLLHPRALVAMARSLVRFWRVLDRIDAVWLLGPHPLCLAFAALAALRRRRVALGVRQDFPVYARSRHPDRRFVHVAADLLERAYRLLARRCPTVVVGPQLARNYRHARRLLPVFVSLVKDADVAEPGEAAARGWGDELTVLTVGRLETEKNPLLLADVVSRLDPRWRLVVCGEGPLEDDLRARFRELGVEDRAELRGYMPIDDGLMDLYRSSDAFLHVSWTEGVPQVLLEAFASGLPTVATAVGGVPDVAGDAALLVPPGDPAAAAAALERLDADSGLRKQLVARALEQVSGRTLEAESARVAAFLQA